MINLLLSLLGTYALICCGGWVLHRYFLYLPDSVRYAPKDVGLADVEEITFEGRGGAKLIAWYSPAKGRKPTLLYFTGNAGSVANRARKIEAIAAKGYGVFMLNYRRYGGSTGWPTEANNISDAVTAYDLLRSTGVKARDIVAYGESLGTGVATRLSLERSVKALVLEAPFTSVVDVGQPSLVVPAAAPDHDGSIPHHRPDRLRRCAAVDHAWRPRQHDSRRRRPASSTPPPTSRSSSRSCRNGGHNDLFDHGAFDKVRGLPDGARARAAGCATPGLLRAGGLGLVGLDRRPSKSKWPGETRPLTFSEAAMRSEGSGRRPWRTRLGGNAAFALRLLARELPCPADGLGLLAGALLRRLFVIVTELHLAEDAFALHLLLQRPEGLIDIVIANDDLHARHSPFGG